MTTERETLAESGAQALKREFTFSSTLALAFSFISPIVALYTVFALALVAGGGGFWWAFPIAVFFQLSVALIFAELVSVWPLAGGVYQWTRALAGNGPGWFAGWVYFWTLLSGLATVCYGGGMYLGVLVGLEAPTPIQSTILSLVVLAVTTLTNTIGRKFMKIIVAGAIIAEVIGSIGVGVLLLLFNRVNDWSILFPESNSFGFYKYLLSAKFASVMAIISFSFFGFESAGSIAEEVRRPRSSTPKALILSLLLVGSVVTFSGLAILMAIPDIQSALAGEVADPVVFTLTKAFGPGIALPLVALFVIGFLAAAIAIQAGASRVVFGLARDNAIPAAGIFKRLSENDRLPINAILLLAFAVAAIFLIGSSTIYELLISLCAGGFFLAFLFPTASALAARLSGRWSPGQFTLGRWGLPVNLLAFVWIIMAMVNIGWPRQLDAPWYSTWGVALGAIGVLVIGALAYSICSKRMTRYERAEMCDAAKVRDVD